MPRVAGVNIPDNKKIDVSLTYIYGIGRSLANEILEKAGIDNKIKTSEATKEELSKIRKIIEKDYKVEGELKREKRENIGRLKRIDCYRGRRHKKGLPVRGQRTKTNSRTVRGNVRRTAGSGRKAAPQAT
jgi:small subunit ribosomal protein S13